MLLVICMYKTYKYAHSWRALTLTLSLLPNFGKRKSIGYMRLGERNYGEYYKQVQKINLDDVFNSFYGTMGEKK